MSFPYLHPYKQFCLLQSWDFSWWIWEDVCGSYWMLRGCECQLSSHCRNLCGELPSVLTTLWRILTFSWQRWFVFINFTWFHLEDRAAGILSWDKPVFCSKMFWVAHLLSECTSSVDLGQRHPGLDIENWLETLLTFLPYFCKFGILLSQCWEYIQDLEENCTPSGFRMI